MKTIFSFLFLIFTTMVLGQGFTYSYADPCTSKTKEIFIPNPSQSVVLSYNGSVQSFTYAQLQSGAMEQWINEVNSQNPSGPCSGVGLQLNTSVNATIAANNIQVLTTVLTSMSSISSAGMSNVEGIIQADEKVSSNNERQKDKTKIENNATTNINGGSTTTTNTNSGTSQSGGNQNNGSGVGNGTNPQGGTTSNPNNPTTTGGQSSQSPVTSGNNTSPNTNNSTTQNTNNSSGVSNITGGINSVKLDKSHLLKLKSFLRTPILVILSNLTSSAYHLLEKKLEQCTQARLHKLLNETSNCSIGNISSFTGINLVRLD